MAPTKRKRYPCNHPGQRRTAGRLRRGWEEWAGIAAEIIPEGVSNAGQSLSQPAADSSLCTREPLGRGCGLPRRFAPRNDSPKPLSFRGGPTDRGGNPSFFTMDGGSGRRTKDEGNGTPRSSAPTERRESPINHPSQPARSEAFAPVWARDGRESAQRPSQKGDRLRDCRCSA